MNNDNKGESSLLLNKSFQGIAQVLTMIVCHAADNHRRFKRLALFSDFIDLHQCSRINVNQHPY